MRYISHRGNLFGREEENENNPTHILKALAMGFEVEIDVWCVSGEFFLGHDKPQYHIPVDFLFNSKFWCHAKNKEALEQMLNYNRIHCFWHESDERTLTSQSYIWTHKGKDLVDGSICVLPDSTENIPENIKGICSDEIFIFKHRCEE